MKNVEYIIVGLGLAGCCFAETLQERSHSFIIFENDTTCSSEVALGVYNPVILRKFTPVWQAKKQLKIALQFYKKIEKKLQKNYNERIKIYRLLDSVEEQNNWFYACDKIPLNEFMSPQLVKKKYMGVKSPYHFGCIYNTGRIQTKYLLQDIREYWRSGNNLIQETFDYQKVIINKNEVIYKDYIAKYIVFCEGYGLKKNPFFNYLPLTGSKGEILTIYAPELKVDVVIKSGIFVCPLGGDFYKIGATFCRNDKTLKITKSARKELEKKLQNFIKIPYEIVSQSVGIRPTTKDRHAFLGRHSEFSMLVVFNGLGTRGVMMAPNMALDLYHYLNDGKALDITVDIQRFEDRFKNLNKING